MFCGSLVQFSTRSTNTTFSHCLQTSIRDYSGNNAWMTPKPAKLRLFHSGVDIYLRIECLGIGI